MINPIEFLEEYFLLEDTGKPIVLEPWQKDFLNELLVDRQDISLALLSATKKTGKSTLAAGIALYVLFCWQSPVEVLFIANSREQSKTLAYRKLAYACENQPELKKSCTVYKSGRVVVDSTGAVARCIPTKAKSVAGPSPSLIVWDEAWGLTDEDEALWTELTSIPTKRSLTLVASYAGLEGQSPLLKRLYDLGKSKDKPKDMLFFWSHNPRLSSWVTTEYLESQRKKLLPHQYQRLFGNVWGSGAGAFLSRQKWDLCYNPELKPLEPGASDLVYLGLDMGLRRDSGVLVGTVKNGDNRYSLALFKQWRPRHGDEIELENVFEFLLTINAGYNVSGVWFDPRFLASISQRLRARGVNMVEVPPQSSSVSRCYEFLYQTVKGERFSHWNGPTLTDHIMNATAVDGPSGIMLEKPSRGRKIDGAVSLALSLWGASQSVEKKIELLRADPVDTYVAPSLGPWRGMMKPHQDHSRMRRTVDFFNR